MFRKVVMILPPYVAHKADTCICHCGVRTWYEAIDAQAGGRGPPLPVGAVDAAPRLVVGGVLEGHLLPVLRAHPAALLKVLRLPRQQARHNGSRYTHGSAKGAAGSLWRHDRNDGDPEGMLSAALQHAAMPINRMNVMYLQDRCKPGGWLQGSSAREISGADEACLHPAM